MKIFTHLSLELQQRIPGDLAGGIHYRFFQELTHALLFHFDAIFVKFHGVFGFLGHSKIGIADHTEIEGFPRIGLDIRGKCPHIRVHTRLFGK